MTNNKLFKLHKIIVVVAALGQLAITTIHNSGLVLLINQYSGFIMFMFVLLSLMCLFNTTRIKDTTIKGMLPTILGILVTVAFGLWLSILYAEGLFTSMNISTTNILIAFIFTVVITSALVTSLICLLLSKFSTEKKTEQVETVEV